MISTSSEVAYLCLSTLLVSSARQLIVVTQPTASRTELTAAGPTSPLYAAT